MIPKAMMPEPKSKASEPRANNETGPPVSGSGAAEAVAELVALAVAVELAVGEAVGLAVGLASSPKLTSGRSLAWQPSGVSLGKFGSGQGSAEGLALSEGGTEVARPTSPLGGSTPRSA
jgi:hypothetical protein